MTDRVRGDLDRFVKFHYHKLTDRVRGDLDRFVKFYYHKTLIYDNQ